MFWGVLELSVAQRNIIQKESKQKKGRTTAKKVRKMKDKPGCVAKSIEERMKHKKSTDL